MLRFHGGCHCRLAPGRGERCNANPFTQCYFGALAGIEPKKGNLWHFGMTAHIDADANSGLVHTVRGTTGNVHDVLEGNNLLHGQEVDAYGYTGYQDIHKRPDAKLGVTCTLPCHTGQTHDFGQERSA